MAQSAGLVNLLGVVINITKSKAYGKNERVRSDFEIKLL